MIEIEQAIIIAAKAHNGQLDKGGQPYIFHPLRVMMAAETIDEKIVAILHDVIEDSAMTVDDLREQGVTDDQIAALLCLTKQTGEDYMNFIRRVMENPLARKVKICDIKDNMKLDRIPNPNHEDYRRVEKYRAALAVLE